MRVRVAVGFLPFAALVVLVSCARDPEGPPEFTLPPDAGSTTEGGNLVGNGSTNGHPCFNLECQQVDCASHHQPDTTISGVVYDPAGSRPLYNVVVYVPNSPVAPLQPGVVCDQCGVLASGSPLVSTLTGPDGHFVLHDVPVGDQVPLVLQLGKWRRQLVVPHVSACADTAMLDPTTMRLPARQSEGDMPQIAIATGGCDAFECLLQKIGIDPAEFTNENGGGRVHVYQGAGGATLASPTSPASSLWASPNIGTYDLVLNACECSEESDEKPQSSIDNLVTYANAGGRVFNTHYHYYWIDPTKIADRPAVATNPAWQSTASFIPEVQGTTSIDGNVDTSFPKGAAFADWLVNVGATRAKGQFPIDDARYNAIAATPPSTQWVGDPNLGQTETGNNALLHYTFNTPVGADESAQCGKVLFSDFHVVGSTSDYAPFPQECETGAMTPQELALEFMLFDLSACIQPDKDPPRPPQTTQ
jgi:hypothetical protein